MGTTHANTPTDALVRLETLATMGDTSIPLAALRRQIAGAVHLVVQAKRLHDGSRKITNISEVLGVDEHGRYETQDIFKFVQTGIDENHKILGRMEGMGIIPTFYEEIEVNGLSFDIAKFGTPPKPKYPKTTTALNSSAHGAPAAHAHAPAPASHGHAPAAPAPAAAANNPAVAAAMAKLSPAQLAQLNAGAAKAGMPVQAYYQALIKQQAAKKNGGQAA
jgi:hypothetical protein